MQLFLSYLKSKRKPIVFLLCFAMVLIGSFLLYRLPLKAVLYPLGICFLLGCLYICDDFARFKQRHEKLIGIGDMTSALIAELPDTKNLESRDYQAIIAMLREESARLRTEEDLRYQEMMDYYTVWVHQIKTPISAMKLSLQNEDSAFARKLSSELFRIEQYVEMVLAFLRIDSDYSDYVFRKYNADEIIRLSIKKFAPEFIGRKIGLDYEPVDITLVTDEKWLCFVIEQLLSNALKYTKDGCIRIYAEGKTLRIADTGIGIAPEDLPRIFQKGYTGYNGRMDKSSSGLGLYLCKKICDRLGIEISAESEIGKGTVMSLNLEQYNLNLTKL